MAAEHAAALHTNQTSSLDVVLMRPRGSSLCESCPWMCELIVHAASNLTTLPLIANRACILHVGCTPTLRLTQYTAWSSTQKKQLKQVKTGEAVVRAPPYNQPHCIPSPFYFIVWTAWAKEHTTLQPLGSRTHRHAHTP